MVLCPKILLKWLHSRDACFQLTPKPAGRHLSHLTAFNTICIVTIGTDSLDCCLAAPCLYRMANVLTELVLPPILISAMIDSASFFLVRIDPERL